MNNAANENWAVEVWCADGRMCWTVKAIGLSWREAKAVARETADAVAGTSMDVSVVRYPLGFTKERAEGSIGYGLARREYASF